MKKIFSMLVVFAMTVVLFAPLAIAAPKPTLPNYQPMEFTAEMRNAPGSVQPLPADETAAVAAASGSTDTTGAPVGTQRPWVVIAYPSGYALRMFTLRAVGVHGEVWVANNINFPNGDPRNPSVVTDEQIKYLLDQFDSNMYPKETAFFGDPVTRDGANAMLPYGYNDGSSRVAILVDNIRDESYYDYTYPNYIAGYYSSTIRAYTDRNVITIDSLDWANRVGANARVPFLYEGTFAHEFQHLLHDDHDPDEETWINEGQADFAMYLTGYSDINTDGHVISFLQHPYNSLVSWEDRGPRAVLSDYGAAYLFQVYLNQRFGESFIQALHNNQLNGIEGVNDALKQMGFNTTFEEVYRDWQTALLLSASKPSEPQYRIDGLNRTVDFKANDYTGSTALAWGPSYNVINNANKVSDIKLNGISFLASPWTTVADPLGSGQTVLWGNTATLLDSVLVKPLDLTGVATATLSFDTYYDTEEQWDFGFVQVSTDNGATWTSLANADTRSDVVPEAHPTVQGNLPGFTGNSGAWVNEKFDLSAYAGKKVLLSFRYVTDWGYEASGFYVKNITVPEIGFSADGTTTEGFESLEKATGSYTNYLVTFVGLKDNRANANGSYKVLNLDLVNFDDDQQLELNQFLHDSSLSTIYMVVSYAAPQGQATSVPFSYSVDYLKANPKK